MDGKPERQRVSPCTAQGAASPRAAGGEMGMVERTTERLSLCRRAGVAEEARYFGLVEMSNEHGMFQVLWSGDALVLHCRLLSALETFLTSGRVPKD